MDVYFRCTPRDEFLSLIIRRSEGTDVFSVTLRLQYVHISIVTQQHMDLRTAEHLKKETPVSVLCNSKKKTVFMNETFLDFLITRQADEKKTSVLHC